MSKKSLCFKGAYDAHKRGEINQEEYLRHMVAHYGGLRHPEDAKGQRPYLFTLFEDRLSKYILDGTLAPLDEEGMYILAIKSPLVGQEHQMLTKSSGVDCIYSILLSGLRDDAAAVKIHVDAFKHSSEYYLRPLLDTLKTTGNPQILRICFQNDPGGVIHDDDVSLMYDRVDKNPNTEWLDVLYDFDYRHWRTDPRSLCEQTSWFHLLFMGADCARWWIEHGGSAARARGIFDYAARWPWLGAGPTRVVLDQFGIDWFTDSGWLQLAAKNNDFESIKMLVEVGADVNEKPTAWNRDVREYSTTPLSALHEAVYAKSAELIWYLVEHGATLEQEYIDDKWNTRPKEYKPFVDMVVELGAVRE